MQKYKINFIEFMVRSQVLTFGDFVTKSGRKTPFFINTGKYKTAQQIKMLGEFYAEAILHTMPHDARVLFGPAYKGIPLVVTTAIALFSKTGIDYTFCFNRKEVKQHGEGGSLIGHTITDTDKIIIVEDVATAGTSVRETVPLLKSNANPVVAGLIVSVDRMEKGVGAKSALRELHEEFGMVTGAIVTLDEIVMHLYNRQVDGKIILTDEIKMRIDDYRAEYGALQ